MFETALQCKSPQEVVTIVCETLRSGELSIPHSGLRILDVAAGSGCLGVEIRDQLSLHEIECLVGTDLSDFARLATLRDRRADLYDEYVVTDLLKQPQSAVVESWKKNQYNVVTICAALGPSNTDLPLEVIDAAIEFLKVGGLLVFTVNSKASGNMSDRYKDFLNTLDQGTKTHWNEMKEIRRKPYKHRLNVKGKAIDYTAFVYQKTSLAEVEGCYDK